MSSPRIDLAAVRAALFDMDGVVIDSEPLSARIMRKAAREFGFDVPESAMPSCKGLPGDVVFDRVAREFGRGSVDGSTLRGVRDRLYEDALPGVALMPGVRAVLERLTAAGRPMALVTSSRRRHAETVLATHDLARFFPTIVGSEDVDLPKPSPDPYRKAAIALGYPPSACLAVEDSTNGVRSARAAGCRVVGFGREFGPDELTEAGADYLCRDHDGLAASLTSDA